MMVVDMLRARLASAFAIGYLLVPTATIWRPSSWLQPVDDVAIVGTLVAYTIYRRNPS